jgi:hypothetical protein
MTNIPQNAAGIFPANWQYWSNLRALPTDFRFASFSPRLSPQAQDFLEIRKLLSGLIRGKKAELRPYLAPKA